MAIYKLYRHIMDNRSFRLWTSKDLEKTQKQTPKLIWLWLHPGLVGPRHARPRALSRSTN